MNTNRLIGIILTVVGIGVAVIAGLWIASQVAAGSLTSGGALVGAGLAFIPVALLAGFGIYLYVQGGKEAQQESVMEKQRQLLDVVKSRGQVTVSNLAIELGINVDTVRSMIHELVGLQVFSGYVNWNEGVLYSSEAATLRDLHNCKNCGGEITLAGRGIVACKHCGTEYFLS